MSSSDGPSNNIHTATTSSTGMDDDIISFNVGGASFKCRSSTLRRRFPNARLARLANASTHEARLRLCDAHFPAQNEYFFERSPKLFESVFKLYVGREQTPPNNNVHHHHRNQAPHFHRPLDACESELAAELAYWQISGAEFTQCCSSMPQFGFSVQRKLTKTPSTATELAAATMAAKLDDGRPLTHRERIYQFCEGDGSCTSTLFTFVSICFVLISVLGLVLGSVQDFQVQIEVVTKGTNSTASTTTYAPLTSGDDDVIASEYNSNVTTDDSSADSSAAASTANRTVIWEPHPFFGHLETTCIVWFTIEYALRLSVAPSRLQFIVQLVNVVDLIAILPFFLEAFLALCGVDVTGLSDIKGAFLVVRIMRVLRVVRILKLGRYSSGMRTFALTLRSSARQLGMMGMVLCTGVVFFSTLLYFVEKDEPHTPFSSIPATFWWAIVTMSTVGYGDCVPVTIPGKLIASGAILSGVLVLALPITIIVDNFMKVSGTFNGGNNPFSSGGAFGGPPSSTPGTPTRQPPHRHTSLHKKASGGAMAANGGSAANCSPPAYYHSHPNNQALNGGKSSLC